MNFRYLLLAAILGLSACNGSDSSTNKKEADSTFSDLADAKAELEKVNAQKEAGERDKIVLAGEIAALEARQEELRSAIGSAAAELNRLQGEDGKGGEIATQKAYLADLISQADRKVADIETAKQTLVQLGSIADKSSAIGLAKSSYDKLVEDTETKTEELNKATELLEKLQGNDGKGGSIKEARDRLIALEGEDGKGGSIKIATDSLADLNAKLAILNGKGEGSIFEAQEKLKELKGDGTTGNPGAIALAQNELEERRTALLDLTGDGTDKNPGEIAKATKELVDLVGEDGKGGKVADARKTLADVDGQIATARETLKSAQEALETLQGKDGKGGDIAAARKTLDTLSADIKTAQDELAAAQEAWKKLAGDDGKGGEIALEQKKLADLIEQAANKAEDIRKAGLELERIKVDGKATTDKATLDAARILSQAAFDAGRFDDAGTFLTAAGLNDEAIELYKKAGKNEKAGDLLAAAGKSEEAIEQYKKAGSVDKAAALLTAAGKLEDAYKLYAPEDKSVDDSNPYGEDANGSVAFDKIDETPSVKRHSMQLGGKTVWFTAKAGHLIAYGQKDKNNPDAKRDPQAAVFYMSYTRDDMPKETRPVTFFFNGGPGESSIWLHLGAWAPWRLKVDQPNVPADAKSGPPKSYPFVGNPETLLDKSDLVFVDPIGSGYSQAISSDVKKHINKDFWGVDADAKIMRDFITRYSNTNKRQTSPKYLFGESYGGGIRVPVLTKMLIDAGTEGFEGEKAGKTWIALTGSVLYAPVVNYASNCRSGDRYASCAGFLPTYILTGAYFDKPSARTMADRADEARVFTRTKHMPAIQQFRSSGWDAFKTTADGKAYLSDIARLTRVSAVDIPGRFPMFPSDYYDNYWAENPNMDIGRVEPDRGRDPLGFMNFLKPGQSYNAYDTRMLVQGAVGYDFEYSEDNAFKAEMAKFLPNYLNYSNKARHYVASAELTSSNWSWDWSTNRAGVTKIKSSSLSDLTLAINYAPEIKLMTLHGYFDGVTPFFQTELDFDLPVKVNGADMKLSDRIPTHVFEGGHMVYFVEKERPALKRTMDDFYDAPPYSPPATVPAQKSAVLQ